MLSLQSHSVKQIFFLLIGVILMSVVSVINYKKIAEHSSLLFIICFALLLYTLIFGKVVNNSKRWISIGEFITLQPSEFIKILMIIVFADVLNRFKDKLDNILYIFLAFGIFSMPMILVFLQPDLGTALVFVPIMLSMMFVGGINIKYFLSIILLGVLSILIPILLTFVSMMEQNESVFLEVISNNTYLLATALIFLFIGVTTLILNIRWQNTFLNNAAYLCLIISLGIFLALIIDNYLLKEYQRKRLLAFINPRIERWGLGYNVIQSQITVGSGRIMGKGWLEGTQGQLGFLPARSTDFIFSVIGEEVGFIGSLVVISLFFLLLSRLVKIAKSVKDYLGGLIVVGITAMFGTQIFINIGMTIGVAPVTGLPLPFLTSGGSTLLTSLVAVGLVFNIQANKYVHAAKKGDKTKQR